MSYKRSEGIGSTTLPFVSPRRILPARWRVRRWSRTYRTYAHPTSPPLGTALLSSLAAVGRTMVASSGGVLADKLGWVRFFLLTTGSDDTCACADRLDRPA